MGLQRFYNLVLKPGSSLDVYIVYVLHILFEILNFNLEIRQNLLVKFTIHDERTFVVLVCDFVIMNLYFRRPDVYYLFLFFYYLSAYASGSKIVLAYSVVFSGFWNWWLRNLIERIFIQQRNFMVWVLLNVDILFLLFHFCLGWSDLNSLFWWLRFTIWRSIRLLSFISFCLSISLLK